MISTTDNLATKTADRHLPTGKVWMSCKYMNKISYRALNKYERLSPGNLHLRIHASWDEAHAAIVADREQQLLQAETDLKRAKASLARAMAMKSKEPKP